MAEVQTTATVFGSALAALVILSVLLRRFERRKGTGPTPAADRPAAVDLPVVVGRQIGLDAPIRAELAVDTTAEEEHDAEVVSEPTQPLDIDEPEIVDLRDPAPPPPPYAVTPRGRPRRVLRLSLNGRRPPVAAPSSGEDRP